MLIGLGHGSLAGRSILGGMTAKAQGLTGGNGVWSIGRRVTAARNAGDPKERLFPL